MCMCEDKRVCLCVCVCLVIVGLCGWVFHQTPLTCVEHLLDDHSHLSLEHGVEQLDDEDEARAKDQQWEGQQDQTHGQIWQVGIGKDVAACGENQHIITTAHSTAPDRYANSGLIMGKPSKWLVSESTTENWQTLFWNANIINCLTGLVWSSRIPCGKKKMPAIEIGLPCILHINFQIYPTYSFLYLISFFP